MATKKPKTAEASVPVAQAPAINRQLLAMIATATTIAPYYMNADASELAKLGTLVEVNPDPQYATQVGPAARISAEGTAWLAANPAVSPFGQAPTSSPETQVAPAVDPVAVPVAAPSFEIKAFVLPEAKRGPGGNIGARPEKYPFSKLEPGQAFFIPATADRPNPAKQYASAVNSASERYATEDTNAPKIKNRKGAEVFPKIYERKFAIRSLTAEQAVAGGFVAAPGVAGAAVGRIK